MTTLILAAALFGACCLSQWYRGSVEATDRALGGSDDLAVARARLASSAALVAAETELERTWERRNFGRNALPSRRWSGELGPVFAGAAAVVAVVGIAAVSVEALVVVASVVVPLLFVAHLSR